MSKSTHDEISRIARECATDCRRLLIHDERFFFAPLTSPKKVIQTEQLSPFELIDKLIFDELKIDQDTQNYFAANLPSMEVLFEPSIADIPSYALGCCFGRWDIRAISERQNTPKLSDLLESLPDIPPGTLQVSNHNLPKSYPLRINWEGILVDDAEHPDDIVCRVREVLEIIWNERHEVVERELCEQLGVKELRDYCRKVGSGGLFDDLINRYSKSRRKAPIYWLLQSSNKGYAVWLYYHCLDKDILFKVLQKYVEPKIQLERNRLSDIKSRRQSSASGTQGLKKLERDIEKQEDFLTEIEDFREKLERTANLNFGKNKHSGVVYEPDLNDGVTLNIAPLQELVPWKEVKQYWDDLLDGEYDWSSMSKLLKRKGLVK